MSFCEAKVQKCYLNGNSCRSKKVFLECLACTGSVLNKKARRESTGFFSVTEFGGWMNKYSYTT